MEARPGAAQGLSLSPASRPRPTPMQPEHQGVKLPRARTPPVGPFRPDSMEVLHAQSPPLDSSGHAEEGARYGGPRRAWPPTSGLECWHRPDLQPLDTDQKRPVGPENSDLGASPAPQYRTGHLSPHRGASDSSSLSPRDHWVPRPALFGGLRWAVERGALGTGARPLSLSEQVEKNRLLLKEMLRGGGPASLKPPDWDRATPGRPAGDASGRSEPTRTCEPPPEPPLRLGQDKQLPPRARVKARMRPLRASHDIVPSLALDSRSPTTATPRRPREQEEATGPPQAPAARPAPWSCSLSHPPLSTTDCNDRGPGGLPAESGTETDPPSLKPQAAPGSPSHGGPQAAGSCGLSEEPGCSQEAEGAPQRTESTPGRPATLRQSWSDHAGPGPPTSAAPAPSDQNRRSGGRGSLASGLGLKKLISVLGQAARPSVGRTHSHSVEQLRPPTLGPTTPEAKRTPSLQSLPLVSRSPQRRKAASFHGLQALLSGRGDRASLYQVQEPVRDGAEGSRPAGTPPRRALSVEDVGAPRLARTVGRVVAAFPDGTSQLQLQRTPGGSFGFCVASGNGRRDSGLYVREMADVGTAKLYSGLLAVGDEILEVNGAKVAALGTAHVQELLARADSVSLRVLRQRPAPR